MPRGRAARKKAGKRGSQRADAPRGRSLGDARGHEGPRERGPSSATPTTCVGTARCSCQSPPSSSAQASTAACTAHPSAHLPCFPPLTPSARPPRTDPPPFSSAARPASPSPPQWIRQAADARAGEAHPCRGAPVATPISDPGAEVSAAAGGERRRLGERESPRRGGDRESPRRGGERESPRRGGDLEELRRPLRGGGLRDGLREPLREYEEPEYEDSPEPLPSGMVCHRRLVCHRVVAWWRASNPVAISGILRSPLTRIPTNHFVSAY